MRCCTPSKKRYCPPRPVLRLPVPNTPADVLGRRVDLAGAEQVEYCPEFSPSDGLLILHVHEVPNTPACMYALEANACKQLLTTFLYFVPPCVGVLAHLDGYWEMHANTPLV